MSCPSENALNELVMGTLDEPEERAVRAHLDGCTRCRQAVAALLRQKVKSQPRAPEDDEATVVNAPPLAVKPIELALQADEVTLSGKPTGRYQLRGALGQGGMGEVYEVKDVDLKRVVALKRVRAGRGDEAELKRFIQEGQLTAQLEHPNIIPVHELGRLPSGEPFYTMKRVHGRTLHDVLAALRAQDPELTERYSPVRLGIVFLQIVQAIAFAHARGVVHCDLKPANVLLGEHGEVLVTDWGLALMVGAAREVPGLPPISLSSPKDARSASDLAGTPRYMAPEQLRQEGVSPRSDVYALGLLLYELLTLAPARSGSSVEALLAEAALAPVPPRVRAPGREIPAELEEICLTALAADPARRYADGEALRVALEDSLTGVRRRLAAQRAFAEAEAQREALRSLRAAAAALQAKATALEAGVKPYDGEVRKAPLWEAQAAAQQAAVQAEQQLARCLDEYARVLGLDGDFLPAADRLADLHLEQFLAAEKLGDERTARFHRLRVEAHHRGRHERILRGRGTVALTVPGAATSVEAWPLEERALRLVRGEPLRVPPGPRVELELPVGSYLFRLRAQGHRELLLPVLVEREERVELSPRLYPEAQLLPDFVLVPAGPFLVGGDPAALNSVPRERRTLPDYLLARFPVTCDEYLAFLNALAARSPHLAAQHVPRTKPDGGHLWEHDVQGRYVLPKLDADGNPVHPKGPVMGVSWHDAQAYAQWRSEAEGIAYRLPTEDEWEKGARGADGRVFPWGNGFDPTFCKMALSRPGRPQPEPVGSFEADCSPYGVRDCAGGIRQWTDSFFDASHETRVLRGGAWYFNPHYCRAAFRHGYLPHIVFTNFGFRLAVGLP